MLEYPKTLERSPLLAFTLSQLAADRPMNRLIYYGTIPLGFLENGSLGMQDHFEMLYFISKEWWQCAIAVRRLPRAVEWDTLIAQASSQVRRTHRLGSGTDWTRTGRREVRGG